MGLYNSYTRSQYFGGFYYRDLISMTSKVFGWMIVCRFKVDEKDARTGPFLEFSSWLTCSPIYSMYLSRINYSLNMMYRMHRGTIRIIHINPSLSGDEV
ncbi:hypothetical protein F5050DRAFT_897825 [Lentinula boryana]|uniref:Uncharacterized protein n=1 Tax=Lentinula boryana TaxID=40481 RepID=A0ABQ8Q1L9_9AGAR|nr:hypothetical protein F5050DRAFT_897825 [Lentinula boryana]